MVQYMKILVILLMVIRTTGPAQAGSIWAKRSHLERDLYTDDVARQVGDLLTVTISEDSRIENKAQRDMSKEIQKKTDFKGSVTMENAPQTISKSFADYIPGISMDASGTNDFTSKADFKDERSYVDSITVVVIDILPNENLVVMGTRNRDIGGEIQTVEASGIVRPSDISFGNIVTSDKVANFRLVTRNSGISKPYTKPNFINRVLDILWPW